MSESTQVTRELTYGERAVGLTFNHGEGEIFHFVQQAKTISAEAINQMNDLRSTSTSSEQKRLLSIAITEHQAAQMWAVKAITWKD